MTGSPSDHHMAAGKAELLVDPCEASRHELLQLRGARGDSSHGRWLLGMVSGGGWVVGGWWVVGGG